VQLVVVVAAAKVCRRPLNRRPDSNMPCLYFEPTSPAVQPSHAGTRLPLIEEYDGRCHAVSGAPAAVSQMRWQCCNQGYSLGRCAQFPSDGFGGALRYSVVSQSESLLELIWIEERDHAPFRHGGLHFAIAKGGFLETGLDSLIAAQALAYCASYLKRYSERGQFAHPATASASQSIT